MRSVFLTSSPQPLPRWKAAFPMLILRSSVAACLKHGVAEHAVWVDIAAFPEQAAQDAVSELAAAGARVVALSVQPSDQEAFLLLSLGARGYCHAEAVPAQLQEVSLVIEGGGYWMPPGLVQRLLKTSVRRDVTTEQPTVVLFDQLTQREYAVAQQVGNGLNNREIAEVLDITERTVKAHLTAIFEKLGLRDRVQLALAVNRLPLH